MLEQSNADYHQGVCSKGFERFSFSEKMIRFQRRSRVSGSFLRAVSPAYISSLLERIRKEMTIAQESAIARVVAKNPKILREVIIPGANEEESGLFAYLPLNDVGVAALVSGTFCGLAPDPDFICHEDERPCAIYIWLVYTPRQLGASLSLLADLIDEAAPVACPVFSKAVNLHAAQLNDSLGFLKASQFYRDCPSDLLVVLPRQDLPGRRNFAPTISVARDQTALAKVFAVRSSTYIAEQFCHYDEEFDGNDFCSTHWLAEINGDAAGCIRARFFSGFAKIERLAVRTEYRNSRLAYDLVRAAISHCRQKGYTRLYGHSRLDLVRFWRTFGFRPLQGRPTFTFADVTYVEMECTLAPMANALSLHTDPMVLIRPEGDWHKPGPFERAPAPPHPNRQAMIDARSRTVKGLRIAG